MQLRTAQNSTRFQATILIAVVTKIFLSMDLAMILAMTIRMARGLIFRRASADRLSAAAAIPLSREFIKEDNLAFARKLIFSLIITAACKLLALSNTVFN